MSIPIYVTIPANSNSTADLHIHPVIELDSNKEYSISLYKMYVWNSNYNISSALNNNTMKYSNNNGTTWFDITFPDGVYSITELLNHINDTLYTNGDIVNSIYFQPIAATGKIKLVLSTNFQVDFTTSLIYNTLGFNSGIYTTDTTAPYQIDILNGVREYLLHCNLLHNTYRDNTIRNILFSFTMQAESNSLLTITPNVLLEHPMSNKKHIQHMKLHITDQNYNVVNFTQECELVLLIKPI